MPRRVALYARYSSDLQNPTSASDQLSALREDIARRFPEWKVVVEERDEALSGTSMDGREGLARLMKLATESLLPFDVIVVEDVSRFVRNRSDAVRVREALAATGVAILSAADGYVDPESEAGLFLTGMREIKAEADSRETGRRVRRGVRARTKQGWLSGRKTPFGYVRVPLFSETETDRDGRPARLGVKLERDPMCAPVVTHLFKRHAQGVGLKRIARELNDPAGPHRSAKPEGYAVSFLRALLLNPVYRGQLVYGRTRECKVRVGDQLKRRKRPVPPEEWVVVDGAHEALVDKETWDTVQARFERNRGSSIGRGKTPVQGGRAPASVLSGMVRCAACGRSFVCWTSGRNSKQRRRGTQWSQRRFACNRARSSGGDLCNNKTSVEASILERASFDALERHVLTEDGLAYLEARRREVVEEHLRKADGRSGALKSEWERIQKDEQRLRTAIKAGLPVEGLREEADGLAERRRQISGEVEQLSRLEAAQSGRMDRHLAKTRVRHLREVLEAPDLTGVRAALKDLIVGIEARPDGSFWLLVGEGPLGSDDLALLPPNDDGGGSHALAPADPRSNGSPARGKRATPGRPSGRAQGSLISMVGASRDHPATRAVEGRVGRVRLISCAGSPAYRTRAS